MGYPLVGGFELPTPLKNDGVSNSWDDDIPNMMGKIKHIPNHQPNNIISSTINGYFPYLLNTIK